MGLEIRIADPSDKQPRKNRPTLELFDQIRKQLGLGPESIKTSNQFSRVNSPCPTNR